MNVIYMVYKMNQRSVLLSVSVLLCLKPVVVVCDYTCLCSYNVERSVYGSPDENTAPIGYLYEFDCKFVIKTEEGETWAEIAFEHKMGYVLVDVQTQLQTCPGDQPDSDKIVVKTSPTVATTTTTTTVPATSVVSTRPHGHVITNHHAQNGNVSSISPHHVPATSVVSTRPHGHVITNHHAQTGNLSSISPHHVTSTIGLISQKTTVIVPIPISTTPNITSQFSVPSSLVSTNSSSSTLFTIFSTTHSFLLQGNYTQTTNPFRNSTTQFQTSFANIYNNNDTNIKDYSNTLQNTTRSLTEKLTTNTVTKAPSNLIINTTAVSQHTTISNTSTSASFLTDVNVTHTYNNTNVNVSSPINIGQQNSSGQPSTTRTTTTPTAVSEYTVSGRIDLCPYKYLAESHGNAYNNGDYPLFRQLGHYCYELRLKLSDWFTGQADCVTRGGELAVIQDAHVQTLLSSMVSLQNEKPDVWIGLNDMNKEDQWTWVNGDNLTMDSYTHWKPGNMDPVYNEVSDCALMEGSSGYWTMTECTRYLQHIQHRPWICQYKI